MTHTGRPLPSDRSSCGGRSGWANNMGQMSARFATLLVSAVALAAGCGSNIKNTAFQAYQVQLNGPVPTYVGPALDPFLQSDRYRVTVEYYEDAEGKKPYFEGKTKPALFADFQPIQTFELQPAVGERLTLTPTGNDASLPRLSSSQTSLYVKSEIVGLHLADAANKTFVPIARARCPLQELKVLSGGAEPQVLCQAFYGFIGQWNEVRPPAISRVDFAAVALPDGRVVIGGGRVNDDDVADQADVDTVEIYRPTIPDPLSPAASPGSWITVKDALLPGRSGLAAVLTPKSGLLFFVGGMADGAPSSGIDVLSTAAIPTVTKRWKFLETRAEMGVALWDSKGAKDAVLAGGGVQTAGAIPTKSTTVIDSSQQITSGPTMLAFRRSPCFIGLANQTVLACGGSAADNSCELLTGDKPTGNASGTMDSPRGDVKCAATGDAGSESVYLIGGGLPDASEEQGVRIDKWTGGKVTALSAVAPGALTKHALTLAGGTIYVTGGYRPGTTTALAAGFTLDTTTETVTELPEMLNPRAGHQLVTLPDGNIMAIGGLSNRPLARFGAEIFVPE